MQRPRSANLAVSLSNTAPRNNSPEDRVLRFPRPWLFELQLQPRALALACAIVQWTLPSNRGGYCFFSARKLAERLGWSEATVKRAFADLRAAGILETARRGRRIVSPVTQHRVNAEPIEAENRVNGEPTLSKPRSRQNLRLREGASKQRPSLDATAAPAVVAPSLGNEKRSEGKKTEECDEAPTANPGSKAGRILRELEAAVTAEGLELSSSDTVRRKRVWAVRDALGDRKYPRGPDRGAGSPDTSDLLRTVKKAIADGWAERTGADVIRHALKNPENYERYSGSGAIEVIRESAREEDALGDRTAKCEERNAGAHRPAELVEGDDGRFECAHKCGFSKSADLRSYELKRDEKRRDEAAAKQRRMAL